MVWLGVSKQFMTEHILYSFRRCPYAIRARMAVAYAGIQCELRELLLKDKPADMLKHSPKGTVPVLITSQGQVIDESLDVMQWALAQNDPDNWLRNPSQDAMLINTNDHQFKPLLDRYKYADRHPELTENEHRELTLPYIQNLDQSLQEHPFLTGSQIGLADIALFPFIRQYAFVDKTWFDQLPIKNLQTWLKTFLSHSLFSQTMPKFKLFNDGYKYQFPSGKMTTSP